MQATYGGYIDAFVAKIVEEEEGPVCPATAALEGDLQQGNQEAFAAKASSELQADLRAIQEELRHGALLEQFEIVVR